MLLDKLRRIFEPSGAQLEPMRERDPQFKGSPPHSQLPNQDEVQIDSSDRYFPGNGRSVPLRSSDAQKEADEYLARVQKKINKLAEEFASGSINRDQFQELYDHYQREIRSIETWMDLDPHTDAWREACTEGKSVVIRKQNIARILGYAIYQNDSGMPIATIGRFEVDPALYVPMLSSYRSAAREIFGAGMRSSQIENGRWLCFVPGESTTLMALFSTEPANRQLRTLNQVHRVFEKANRHLLNSSVIDPDMLVLPHQSFVDQRR
jgi:hypothetical protein